MTELLNQTAPPQVFEQPFAGEQLPAPSYERQKLLLGMVDKGLISESFYSSGAAESFVIDEETKVDAIAHLLIGDEYGGAHHLPSLLELGSGDITIASTIAARDGSVKHATPGRLRQDQKLGGNGVFKALEVSIKDREGNTVRKDGGSTMFPLEWSTQDVLEAVIATSQTEGTAIEGQDINKHLAEVNGVKVVAITDAMSGKIISAYPRR
ncbi:MAG: EndoU domain-containing protein [Candidatus Saccharibacteria bacterium]